MDKEWYIVPREEQETIINIDYCDKTIHLYTSRYSVGKKLMKHYKPTNIEYFGDKICGVEFKTNLNDKNMNKLLSKSIIVGGFAVSRSKN